MKIEKARLFRGFGSDFSTKTITATGNPKVRKFIAAVRNLSPLMTTMCLEGSCYQFHLLLKEMFPEAVPMYDRNFHVVSLIGDRYYDITGEVQKNGARPMEPREIESQKRFRSDLRMTAIAESRK